MKQYLKLGLFVCFMFLCACQSRPGDACRQHTDCQSLPNGYCSKAEICTKGCAQDVCPEKSACVSEGERRVCLATCATDSECLKGFSCQDKSGERVCHVVQRLNPPAQ